MLNSLEVANPDITDLTVFWLLVTYMLIFVQVTSQVGQRFIRLAITLYWLMQKVIEYMTKNTEQHNMVSYSLFKLLFIFTWSCDPKKII